VRLFLRPGADGESSVLDVHLDGTPGPGGAIPVDLALFADAAHQRLRDRYSAFVQDFARETGLLDIPGWRGLVAAYWLVPFSERSPMRTRLIERLYHLTLLDLAIRKHQPREVSVAGADEKLWRVITRLVGMHGIASRTAAPTAGVPPPGARRSGRIGRLAVGADRIVRTRVRLAGEAFTEPCRQPANAQSCAEHGQTHADPGAQIRKRKTFHSSFPP